MSFMKENYTKGHSPYPFLNICIYPKLLMHCERCMRGFIEITWEVVGWPLRYFNKDIID